MPSFDTPTNGSLRRVAYTGTIQGRTTGYLTAGFNVTGTYRGTQFFSRTLPISNTTLTAANYHGTLNISIIPQLYGSDTATATFGLDY
ncbi:hypothetical protein IAI10_15070 [Clostridium sp. 19966]|uniref:hypothetical protein n=1 Tax=Clostridium sp. 19966 TaxID=2768166 RepID=UPI0028E05E9A|nr:hypothetical protein [Clostridium sp. 19966]MDT8717985.1 hypothetical protein [Clostridium sp. 19966]